MTLSIISISQSEFVSQAAKIPSGRGASLQLSFESESEALLAKQALMISKYFPAVFSVFPDFRQFDPTLSLPSDVREKAVRIFSKNLIPSQEDDVTGLVSSIYASDGSLKGCLVSAAFLTPMTHAHMLYEFLSSRMLAVRITYDPKEQRVNVNILKEGKAADMGFWFDCKSTQIQTFDLQQILERNGYLGLAFPITAKAHEEFIADTEGNKQFQLPESFFEKQIVNNWLVFHLSGEKIVRQSFELHGKTLRSDVDLLVASKTSTKQWLAATNRV